MREKHCLKNLRKFPILRKRQVPKICTFRNFWLPPEDGRNRKNDIFQQTKFNHRAIPKSRPYLVSIRLLLALF